MLTIKEIHKVDDNITENPSNIKDVDASNFVAEVIEKSKEKPVIVDFWAPWCAPCKQLAPVLEKAVSNVNDKISLTKINIDENQSIAVSFKYNQSQVYAFYQVRLQMVFKAIFQKVKLMSL